MRFSVLIPVYNVESYLRECFDSVLDQTYSDYEIVVVNDGSTDSSGALCREFAAAHPEKVRLLEQDNRGLLLARRAAIAAARGDYLVSLDSDDALRRDALELISLKIDETGADIVAYQLSRSASFDDLYFDWVDLSGAANELGEVPLSLARKKLATSHDFNAMGSKAVRSCCVDRTMSYDEFEGLQYGEDLLQMTSILDKAHSVALIFESLYFYRQNPTSISHEVKRGRLRDIEVVRTHLAEYVQNWDAELLPKVFSNDGIEVLTYCFICANRLEKSKSLSEIEDACDTEFFRNAISRADYQGVPAWKKVALLLLAKGRFGSFRLYSRIFFGVLKAAGFSGASRYC